MFRREALEHLNTPEGLDQLMEVTRPAGWLALLGLSAVVLLVAGWGFFWQLPNKLTTTGIVAPIGGVENIVAPSAGQVQSIAVKAGDIVTPGQQVAQIVPTGGSATPLTASAAGMVIAISANPGDTIDAGSALVTVEPAGKPLEVVLYVPLNKASTLQPGMDVQTTLSGIPVNAFGYLHGKVDAVGRYPATKRELQQTLGTDEVVNHFSTAGPLIAVHVKLTPETKNTSGYAWSSPKGPPFPLSGGTFANATIVLSNSTPFKIAF
jgi:hypothetical protein